MKLNYKQSKDYNEIIFINFIQDVLREYPTYDSKIEKRKNDILENLKVKSKDYLKDQENINKCIENDRKLNVYKSRKALLDDILPRLEKYNDKAYLFVKKRYFERKNLKNIMQQLNLSTPTEMFDLDFVAIRYIGNKMRNSKDFLRKV